MPEENKPVEPEGQEPQEQEIDFDKLSQDELVNLVKQKESINKKLYKENAARRVTSKEISEKYAEAEKKNKEYEARIQAEIEEKMKAEGKLQELLESKEKQVSELLKQVEELTGKVGTLQPVADEYNQKILDQIESMSKTLSKDQLDWIAKFDSPSKKLEAIMMLSKQTTEKPDFDSQASFAGQNEDMLFQKWKKNPGFKSELAKKNPEMGVRFAKRELKGE